MRQCPTQAGYDPVQIGVRVRLRRRADLRADDRGGLRSASDVSGHVRHSIALSSVSSYIAGEMPMHASRTWRTRSGMMA